MVSQGLEVRMWIWLVGCLTSPAEYRELYGEAQDFDGDGFASAEFGGPDCDDEDPSIFPGVGEDCDGVDQDCDGSVDEGQDFLTWYPDQDGDGWGEDEGAFESCAVEVEHVLQGGDCNDWDAQVNPAQLEVCDGVDQDCDGVADDGLDFLTWYPDADSDGYGDDSAAIEACDVPEGHVQTPGDCDDSQTEANPGRTEVCGDGIDNDCSGGAPECALVGEYTSGDAVRVFSSGQAGFGMDTVFGDFDGDGVDQLAIGDISMDRGSVYVFDDWTDGGTTPEDADWSFHATQGTGKLVGGELVVVDANGDGFDDLWVGNSNAFAEIDALTNTNVRLFLGGPSGLSADPILIDSPSGRDRWGRAIAAEGSMVAVTWLPYSVDGSGEVYVWLEAPAADAGGASADIVIDGAPQFIGQPLVFGDWTGDGVTDLGIRGSEAWYFGYGTDWQADQPLEDFEDSISGNPDSEGLVGATAAAVDLDRDGYTDLVLSRPLGPERLEENKLLVYFGGSGRPFRAADASDADLGLDLAVEGSLAAYACDLDADGEQDLLAAYGPDVEGLYGPFGDAPPTRSVSIDSNVGDFGIGVSCSAPTSSTQTAWVSVGSEDGVYLFQGPGL